MCTRATVKTIYSLIFIKLYRTSQLWRRQGVTRGTFHPNPENLQRMGNSPRRTASRATEKIKFVLIFLKILLKFSKTFKFFLKHFQNCQENFRNFFKFLQFFSQNTVTFLIYSKCLTFSQKYLKINKILTIF